MIYVFMIRISSLFVIVVVVVVIFFFGPVTGPNKEKSSLRAKKTCSKCFDEILKRVKLPSNSLSYSCPVSAFLSSAIGSSFCSFSHHPS